MKKIAHLGLAQFLAAVSDFCDAITVASIADTNAPGTLRQAIHDAMPRDTVTFDLDFAATVAVTSETLHCRARSGATDDLFRHVHSFFAIPGAFFFWKGYLEQ